MSNKVLLSLFLGSLSLSLAAQPGKSPIKIEKQPVQKKETGSDIKKVKQPISARKWLKATNGEEAAKQTYTRFGYFDKGDIVYTLGTDVSLREKPESSAPAIFKIPIGTAVKVEEKLEKTHKQNGFRAAWHKISFVENGTKHSGFVWGGMLTQIIVRTKQTDGTVFLMGIAKADSTKNHARMQVRAAREGKEVGKVEFENSASFDENSYGYGASFGAVGLKDVNDALLFNTELDAALTNNSQHLLFWNGSKLLDGYEATSKFDTNSFLVSNFIFPTQKDGKPETVVLSTENAVFDDDGKEKSNKKKTILLKWNGKKLIK